MHTDNTKHAKYLSLTTLSNELCHAFFSNRQPSSRHSKRLEITRIIENRIEIIEIKKNMSMNRIEKKLDVKPSPNQSTTNNSPLNIL